MDDKILLVDDDQNVISSFQRILRNKFHIETALSGIEGLEKVKKNGPYSVILSDLRMPGMDGIEFLSSVQQVANDSVRMMLTGNADLQAAIDAVNEGNIFRFMTKPCPNYVLTKALTLGIEQYRLITAERELLEKTLRGSVKVLTDVLELVNPEAFGRSSRIKNYVRDIALHMKISDLWRIETAAMLSQIGCIILPEQIVKKIGQGRSLTPEESDLFDKHPSVACNLLSHIPRMNDIGEIIAHQEDNFDGSGNPKESFKEKGIPLGSRILKVVLDFDTLVAAGNEKDIAFAQLKQRSRCYDPDVLNALLAVIKTQTSYEIKSLTVFELKENMILVDDIRTFKGHLITVKGQTVTRPMIERLKNFDRAAGINGPLRVIEQVQM